VVICITEKPSPYTVNKENVSEGLSNTPPLEAAGKKSHFKEMRQVV